MYKETHCISCGCLIPEDKFICLTCCSENVMQTFKDTQIERPKGRWITRQNVIGAVYCSKCGYELILNNTKFCPECGADMRIEGEQP